MCVIELFLMICLTVLLLFVLCHGVKAFHYFWNIEYFSVSISVWFHYSIYFLAECQLSWSDIIPLCQRKPHPCIPVSYMNDLCVFQSKQRDVWDVFRNAELLKFDTDISHKATALLPQYSVRIRTVEICSISTVTGCVGPTLSHMCSTIYERVWHSQSHLLAQ